MSQDIHHLSISTSHSYHSFATDYHWYLKPRVSYKNLILHHHTVAYAGDSPASLSVDLSLYGTLRY
jgi:hypothetical protein